MMRTINLARSLPPGVASDFSTPCANSKFPKETIHELFHVQLPNAVKQLQAAWNNIPTGHISGLAPINQGGPFDNCVIAGKWNEEQQAMHGGPIPMLRGAPGSRGVPEQWPHPRTTWTKKGHMNYCKSESPQAGVDNAVKQNEFRQSTNWASMDWTSFQFQRPHESLGQWSEGRRASLGVWPPRDWFDYGIVPTLAPINSHEGNPTHTDYYKSLWPTWKKSKKKNHPTRKRR